MRVLVIEDDRETAQYLQKALRESGHVADIAYDGEDGLAAGFLLALSAGGGGHRGFACRASRRGRGGEVEPTRGGGGRTSRPSVS